jgi:hypothetical protein
MQSRRDTCRTLARRALLGIGLVLSCAVHSGDDAPCMTCDAQRPLPYPETGAWRSPEQPGSGFMFEVQNGILSGGWFTYDSGGEPSWRLLNGRLERGARADGAPFWRARVNVDRIRGGFCSGCGPAAPAIVSEPALEFEFDQRHAGRYRVQGLASDAWTSITPITFGSGGSAVFVPESDHLVPDIEGDWVFVVATRNESGGLVDAVTRTYRAQRQVSSAHRIEYGLASLAPDLGFDFLQVGTLGCSRSTTTAALQCWIGLGIEAPYVEFILPIADLGVSRIAAFHPSRPVTLSAWRIDYD